jgi:hypothetical protein
MVAVVRISGLKFCHGLFNVFERLLWGVGSKKAGVTDVC